MAKLRTSAAEPELAPIPLPLSSSRRELMSCCLAKWEVIIVVYILVEPPKKWSPWFSWWRSLHVSSRPGLQASERDPLSIRHDPGHETNSWPRGDKRMTSWEISIMYTVVYTDPVSTVHQKSHMYNFRTFLHNICENRAPGWSHSCTKCTTFLCTKLVKAVY